PKLYSQADVVVFTSRSEGIPVAAMEAMSMERLVLAPRITGIPELITPGETGYLYDPNSIEDLLANLFHIRANRFFSGDIRMAARKHVALAFDSRRNLGNFAVEFLRRTQTTDAKREVEHADPVLQQI
ncbi:MAG TPA: glycosyltransferase, partial [Terriglobales bacterium]|nr:glycosyltransferase [Terriglobales bacterium]